MMRCVGHRPLVPSSDRLLRRKSTEKVDEKTIHIVEGI